MVSLVSSTEHTVHFSYMTQGHITLLVYLVDQTLYYDLRVGNHTCTRLDNRKGGASHGLVYLSLSPAVSLLVPTPSMPPSSSSGVGESTGN